MKKHEQFRSTKLKDVSRADIHTFIEEEVFDLWNDFGQRLDNEQIEHICRRLYDVLSTKYLSWHIGTIHAVFQTGLNGGYGISHKITVKTLFSWLGSAQKQLINMKSMEAEDDSNRKSRVDFDPDDPTAQFIAWATSNWICLEFVDPDHVPMAAKKVSPKIQELVGEYIQAKEMGLLESFKNRLKDKSLNYAE